MPYGNDSGLGYLAVAGVAFMAGLAIFRPSESPVPSPSQVAPIFTSAAQCQDASINKDICQKGEAAKSRNHTDAFTVSQNGVAQAVFKPSGMR